METQLRTFSLRHYFRRDLESFRLCHPEKGWLKYIYYPDIRTVLIFRLSQWCFRFRWLRPVSYLLTIINDLIAGVWIGPRVEVGPGLALAHARGLVVNPTAKLGENCLILQRVTIGGPNVVIGNNVSLNAAATVVSNVRGKAALTIGSHVIVGAGAVVTSDIPSCSIAVGLPAKVVKALPEEEDWVAFARTKCSKTQDKMSDMENK